ncbi:type IV pilus biogenesis/stability protein PilW [Thiogranum longum]
MRSLIVVCVMLAGLLLGGCSPVETRSEGEDKMQGPAEVNTQLGIEYMRQGMYDAALAKFKKALKQDPNLPLAHNSIAVLYEELGEEELADKHYRKAYSLDPKNPATLNNYGQYLCRIGRLEEADEMFLQAVQDPLYRYPERTYTNAGICAQKKPDLEQAEKYFREALQKNPRYQPALRQMVRLSHESNNHLATRAYLQRLQEVAPLTPEFLWIGVRAEAALGDKNAQASYALALKNQYPESEQTQALMEWERKQRGY